MIFEYKSPAIVNQDFQYKSMKITSRGAMLKKSVEIESHLIIAPSVPSKDLLIIYTEWFEPSGDCVTVLNKEDHDWYFVKTSDDKEGFVPRSHLWQATCSPG